MKGLVGGALDRAAALRLGTGSRMAAAVEGRFGEQLTLCIENAQLTLARSAELPLERRM
jgi:hypothetical protein